MLLSLVELPLRRAVLRLTSSISVMPILTGTVSGISMRVRRRRIQGGGGLLREIAIPCLIRRLLLLVRRLLGLRARLLVLHSVGLRLILLLLLVMLLIGLVALALLRSCRARWFGSQLGTDGLAQLVQHRLSLYDGLIESLAKGVGGLIGRRRRRCRCPISRCRRPVRCGSLRLLVSILRLLRAGGALIRRSISSRRRRRRIL